MPTQQSDYDQIAASREKVSNLTKSYGDTMAGATTFGDDVMKNVRAAREARGITNLQEDYGNAIQQLVTDRQGIVDRNIGELAPSRINSLADQQRGNNLNTLARIGQYEEQNAGTVGQAVQAGANTMQAQAVQIKAQAEAAQTELQNLMAVVEQKRVEAEMQLNEQFRRDEMTEKTRQFGISENRLKKGSGGGGDGGGGSAMAALIAAMNGEDEGQGQGNEGLQPPPMSAPEGRTVEWPRGSKNMWTSRGEGVWD